MSCQSFEMKPKESPTQNAREKDITNQLAQLDSILKIDNGRFWGKELRGPILVVDPRTRVFFSNRNNYQNTFRKSGLLFTDTLPPNQNIANTAINWDGNRWTMVVLPLPIQKNSRNTLLIHELFHRIQPEIGFENLKEHSNAHLDQFEGRVSLKLELEALKQALLSKEEDRKVHIRNAIIFRLSRYQNEAIMQEENVLELNEGLAEYTGVMLSRWPEDKLIQHFIESIHQFYINPSFTRSFAYQTVPVYGYLLSLETPYWHQSITSNTNLTNVFIQHFDIEVPKNMESFISEQVKNYDYDSIQIVEHRIKSEKEAKLKSYKNKFIVAPTFKLPVETMNISFNPREVTPFKDYGTYYQKIIINDTWGKLMVDSGAVINKDLSFIIITEPIVISDTVIKGQGWKLYLSKDWGLNYAENKYELGKKIERNHQ